jgi:predicted Rossmann-fold nucleotide-binding protein
MAIRTEALKYIYQEIKTHGSIIINSDEYRIAQQRVTNALKELDEARREFMKLDLARFHRTAIFGGGKFANNAKEARFVVFLAKEVVMNARVDDIGTDIVAGGGSGIMQSAHEGSQQGIDQLAREGIILKSRNHEINVFEDSNGLSHMLTMHVEFSSRLQDFYDKTRIGFIGPGGLGTLLEIIMGLQLKQVGHIGKDYPILLHPFWEPVIESLHNEMYHKRLAEGRKALINKDDLDMIIISDSISEIVDVVSTNHLTWYKDFRSKVVRISPTKQN